MTYVGKHHDEKPKRHIVRAIAISLAVVLVALLGGGFMVYRKLEGNITADNSFADILTQRPEEKPKPKGVDLEPLNILVLGDDSRAGQTGVLGSTPGLSDTTILLHVSADRKRAYAVSVPRDLMVSRPDCRSKTNKATVIPGATPSQWNAAYAYGGPGCTIAQFEKFTGIRVQHFVVVKFDGFKDMVDALGGVPICVPRTIDDTIGRIYLPAGEYEVSGEKALDYVRVRHLISENGDIGRMKRQQAFLASMTHKAVSAGTLVNPVRLYKFLDAATKSLQTDPGLRKLTKLVDLGMQLKDIGLDNIQFLTMPITTYAPDPNRLAPGEGTQRLWQLLRNDKPLPAWLTSGAAKASDTTPGTKGSKGGKQGGGGTPADTDKAAEAEANGLCA